MLITQEQFDQLLAMDDGVLGWWSSADELPHTESGEMHQWGDERGILWLGPRDEVLSNDNEPAPVKGTTDVLLNSSSARLWEEFFGPGALDAMNSQAAHDNQPEIPDCGEIDPETGFACTAPAGHQPDLHIAGTGHGCVAHFFIV